MTSRLGRLGTIDPLAVGVTLLSPPLRRGSPSRMRAAVAVRRTGTNTEYDKGTI
jgi:hypothetical protein